MSLRFPYLRLLVPAAVAVLAAGSGAAQSGPISPFMPPASANVAVPTAGAPIEFRGYMETADGMRFRIYDPTGKKGSWIKLKERDTTLDVLVKEFNGMADPETLVVEHQGKTLTLAQRTSKVVSAGSAMQNVPPPQMTNVPPAVTQAVVVNPTPADEARRLEAVASEVARRRALREQASQNLGQPPVQPQQLPRGPQGGQPNPPPRTRP